MQPAHEHLTCGMGSRNMGAPTTARTNAAALLLLCADEGSDVSAYSCAVTMTDRAASTRDAD